MNSGLKRWILGVKRWIGGSWVEFVEVWCFLGGSRPPRPVNMLEEISSGPGPCPLEHIRD